MELKPAMDIAGVECWLVGCRPAFRTPRANYDTVEYAKKGLRSLVKDRVRQRQPLPYLAESLLSGGASTRNHCPFSLL